MNQNAFLKFNPDFNFSNLTFSVLSGIFRGPLSDCSSLENERDLPAQDYLKLRNE